MTTKKHSLTIEFDNAEALHHFASWLCDMGEQDYWNWMECREREEDGDVTAVHFNYHNEDETKAQDDPTRYGEFVADNTIRTKCGRLDKRGK